MSGQKRHELFGHTDRSHAGSATAVRNAESFVQIEMADIGPDVTGRGQPDLSVHVGTVHVNLATMMVNRGADILDRGFEYPVGGRVGDHKRGQIGGVQLGLCIEISHVDITFLIASNRHDFQSAHGGTRRIGAMGAGGDQADVAVGVAAGFVISADGEQAGIFTLRAGIGLERDGGKTGDLGEPIFQIGK